MTTPNIGLSEVPSNILQPSVPINDAFQLIDALLPGVAQAIAVVPPETLSADAGKVWIIDASATGAWAGRDGELAIAIAADTWRFVAPQAGWRLDVAGVQYRFDGAAWLEVEGSGGGGTPDDGSVTTAKIANGAVTADKLATDVAELIRDTMGTALVAGAGISITVNDAGDTITIAATGGSGSGDVVGPASATADAIAVFDGTTGKLIKDSARTIASLRAPAIQSVTSAATVTPTFSDDLVRITAQAAALNLANPTGTAIPGLGMVIRIKDNGTARTISYGTQYRAIGVTLPTTTVVGKTTYLAMIYNDTDTRWDVVAAGTEA